MKLQFTVVGSGAGDVPYTLMGTVEGESPVDPAAQRRACEAAFLQLTSGAATFGKPGQGGCRGPYKVARFALEVAAES
jgi:hypothetical protein